MVPTYEASDVPDRATARSSSVLLRKYGTVLMVLPIVAVMAVRIPGFLSSTSLTNAAMQMSVMGLVAASITIVMRGGGTDLSAGMLCGLAGVIFAGLLRSVPSMVAILLTLGLGVVYGSATGSLVAYLGIPSLIASLAMRCVLEGIMFAYTRTRVIMVDIPTGLTWLGRGRIGVVPVSLIVMLVVYALINVFLSRTRLGRHISAIGGNREASRTAGVDVRRSEALSYVIAGAAGGLAGLMLTLRTGVGAPGEVFLLDGLAAANIGSTAFGEGEPNIAGTLAGVVMLTLISHGLNMMGYSFFAQMICKGLIFIGCVVLSSVHRKGV